MSYYGDPSAYSASAYGADPSSAAGGADPYAAFYVWDPTTQQYAFDYDSYYRAYGYSSGPAAGGAGSSSSATPYDPSFAADAAAQAAAYVPVEGGGAQQGQEKGKGKERLQKGEKRRTVLRKGAGTVWEDKTLLEWDPSHKRLFVGDLGNDVTDEVLTRAFSKYPSFSKGRVVRNKYDNKTKGYGFVAFADPEDFLKAWKEMNGKYVGSRPVRLKKASEAVNPVEIGSRKERDLELSLKAHSKTAEKGKWGGAIGTGLVNKRYQPYGKR